MSRKSFLLRLRISFVFIALDGNSYTTTATAQVLDVNGNVITNNCAAGTGTRFE